MKRRLFNNAALRGREFPVGRACLAGTALILPSVFLLKIVLRLLSVSWVGLTFDGSEMTWRDCITVAIGFAAFHVGVIGVHVIWKREQARQRLLTGSMPCSKCGYDLRESPDRCPECGATRPALDRRKSRTGNPRRSGV